MRPSKDDYCIGASSQYGLFGSISHWFMSWSGSITSIILNNVLVGVPLANLKSWWIASAIPFVISVTLFSWISTLLYCRFIRNLGLIDRIFLSLFSWNSFICFFWLTYNRSVIKQTNPNVLHDLADSIAMWQNVTVAYLLSPMLILGSIIYVLKNTLKKYFAIVLAVLTGITIGFMDYVSIAVALIFIFILGIANLKNRKIIYGSFTNAILLASFISCAASISFFAPGTKLRKGALDIENIDYDIDLILVIAKRSASDLLLLMLQPSGLLVLCFGVVLYLFFPPIQKKSLSRLLLGSQIVIALHILLNNMSEIYSYQANWHQLPQFTFSIIVWILLGFELGRKLTNMNVFIGWGNSKIVKTFIVVLLIIPQVQSVSNFSDSLKERKNYWQEGNRYHGMDEIKTEWINNCWVDLVQVREDNGIQSNRV